MDLKVKCKTIKLLDRNIEENFPDIRLNPEFLVLTPKASSIKGLIDLHQNEKTCALPKSAYMTKS